MALATPPGRSALAVVRLSGRDALGIASSVAPRLSGSRRPRHPRLVRLRDGDGRSIDTGLATFFAAPASSTGEDVVELSVHGSPAVTAALIAALVEAGARPARPGEFTERAFRLGKTDLVRAEAVRDLIESRTVTAATASARRLEGGLSERLGVVRERLLSASAAIAAALDFSDDVGEALDPRAGEDLGEAAAALSDLAATYETGRLLAAGCRVAILGRPNAGKSTLFNALLGSARAIVTEVPGTTRDALEADLDIGGIPVTLVDTAGICESADPVEKLGVARARSEGERADAILYVFDAPEGLTPEDAEALAVFSGKPLLLAANKVDRAGEGYAPPDGAVAVCGLSPEAGPSLRALLERRIAADVSVGDASELLGSLRQKELVARAADAAAAARAALETGVSPEYAATHCDEALDALADLVGETTSEDVLERLFSTFCVGK